MPAKKKKKIDLKNPADIPLQGVKGPSLKGRAGRPSKINDLDNLEIEKITEFAENGLYDYQIGNGLGLSSSCFNIAREKYPEIQVLIDKARTKSINEVASALRQKALDGNVQSMIYFLDNVGNWKSKVNPFININLKAPQEDLKTEPITYQDAQDQYMKLIKIGSEPKK